MNVSAYRLRKLVGFIPEKYNHILIDAANELDAQMNAQFYALAKIKGIQILTDTLKSIGPKSRVILKAEIESARKALER